MQLLRDNTTTWVAGGEEEQDEEETALPPPPPPEPEPLAPAPAPAAAMEQSSTAIPRDLAADVEYTLPVAAKAALDRSIDINIPVANNDNNDDHDDDKSSKKKKRSKFGIQRERGDEASVNINNFIHFMPTTETGSRFFLFHGLIFCFTLHYFQL